MSIFSSLISPELAVNILRSKLKDIVGYKPDKFQIFFQSGIDEIVFIVNDENYAMSEKNISAMVMSKAKDILKKGQVLTMVMATCEKNISAQIYYTENGQKCFTNFKL